MRRCYRVGDYEAALETLRRSGESNSRETEGGQAADVAFLEMTLHQLGQEAESRKQLVRLRGIGSDDPKSQAFLREAEELIGDAQ